MERRITNQDISWFLDLERNGQLDLTPSYQRRSVWTRKDRQSFLDTIFRGYPCPAIFLYKSISDGGQQIYHVVDGKQRLETVLKFVNNEIAMGKAFGDETLNGKKWRNLAANPELKKKFWNYVFSVEFIDTSEGTVLNEVFDRLNRNVRKLTRQEIRHAKFDGWFITTAETEAEDEQWENLGVVTKARARRMQDVQFISELLIIILKGRIDGFDQDYIDEIYAEYDSPSDLSAFSEEEFFSTLKFAKKYLLGMEAANSVLTTYAKGVGSFFSLWAFVVLNRPRLPDVKDLAKKYAEFMGNVEKFAKEKDPDEFLEREGKKETSMICAYRYFRNTVGASTDSPQRESRHQELITALLG